MVRLSEKSTLNRLDIRLADKIDTVVEGVDMAMTFADSLKGDDNRSSSHQTHHHIPHGGSPIGTMISIIPESVTLSHLTLP